MTKLGKILQLGVYITGFYLYMKRSEMLTKMVDLFKKKKDERKDKEVSE